MYMGLTFIWAVLNTFALEVIAFIDTISIWWQVTFGFIVVSLNQFISSVKFSHLNGII